VRRKVALKIVKPGMDSKQVIARFEAERQALALMDHQNIARVLDAGTTASGRPYFVMELVKGVPITKFCDEQHLSPRERLELFVPVCQAIQHAHQKGIIHRDVKPSNVLVALYDGRPVPKVIDFGVAKAIDQRLTERTLFTQLGQVVGTLEYMSPEQAELNQLDIDTRSDIYSLGVLLYELLTGSTPLEKQKLRSAAFSEMLRMIREEELPRPSTRLSASGDKLPSISAQRKTEPAKLAKLVRGELDWIVMKALEKDRGRRYETANGFARDVKRYLADEPVEACPPSASYRLRKFIRKNRKALVTAAVFVLLLAGLVGSADWMLRDRATRQAVVAARVNDAVGEAERLYRDGKVPEALAAARRAADILATDPADEALTARVRERVEDFETVLQLDDAVFKNGELGERGAEYERLFRRIGIDLSAQSAEEAAARIRGRFIAETLADALRECDGDQAKIKAVARMADPDPWRDRVRQAVERNDWAAVEEVARTAPVDQLPAMTLRLIASHLLWGFGAPESLRNLPDQEQRTREFLRKAQRKYPGDVWLNHLLADSLWGRHPVNLDEAAGFFRVLIALRPNSPEIYLKLAFIVTQVGRPDEGISYLRIAVEIAPKNPRFRAFLAGALHREGLKDEAAACAREATELCQTLERDHALLREAPALKSTLAEARTHLGEVLEQMGDLDGAIRECRAAIENNPKSARARELLGQALRGQGKQEEAAACFKEMVELDSKSAWACVLLGCALRDQGKLDEALVCWKKALERDSKNFLAHSYIGSVLTRQGKLDEANAWYKSWVELEPKDPHVRLEIATFLAGEGRNDEAIVEFREGILACNDKEGGKLSVIRHLHDDLGKILSRQGRHKEAEAEYREAIRLDTKDPLAHASLGGALEKQGHAKEAEAEIRAALHLRAEAEIRAALRLRPDSYDGHQELGFALHELGRYKEAEAEYREAIRLKPDHAEAYRELGVALYDQGRYKEAEAAGRQAIKLQPNDDGAHNILGLALNEQGRYQEAEVEHRAALKLKADDPVLHYNLGRPLLRQQRWKEAEAECREAVRLKPDLAEAHNNLGFALEEQGRHKEAESEYREAIRLKPDDAAMHGDLGRILNDQGRSKEAEAAFSEAIKLQPENEWYWVQRGWAYADLGQWEKASADFVKATECKQPSARAWYSRAMLGLRDGNRDGYRTICADMLQRFGKANDADSAYWVSWTCVLTPNAGAEPAQLVLLAEKGADRTAKGAHGGQRTRGGAVSCRPLRGRGPAADRGDGLGSEPVRVEHDLHLVLPGPGPPSPRPRRRGAPLARKGHPGDRGGAEAARRATREVQHRPRHDPTRLEAKTDAPVAAPRGGRADSKSGDKEREVTVPSAARRSRTRSSCRLDEEEKGGR
jgi:tetratricopeptide (TPR) repeat protein